MLDVDRPALVLGSTQPDTDVDRDACAAAGVEVVRRRSGGGAVLLEPGRVLWVDIVVARTDALWDDDVGRAGLWLGDAWVQALTGLPGEGGPTLADLRVHRGGLEQRRWGRRICFAGVGPGEVVAGSGAKVVGVAQRRTRDGALFQCAVPLGWDPTTVCSLLTWPDPAERAEATRELAGAVAPVDAEAGVVARALLDALPF